MFRVQVQYGGQHSLLLQVTGQYKVSNKSLQGLHRTVKKILASFQYFKIEHVLR